MAVLLNYWAGIQAKVGDVRSNNDKIGIIQAMGTTYDKNV